MQMEFEIIYQDEHFVAINKPCGILVHRTKISEDQVFVLQLKEIIKEIPGNIEILCFHFKTKLIL